MASYCWSECVTGDIAMLFHKRSFSQECRIRLSPVMDLIHETLDNKIKEVDQLADACQSLKQDTLLTQGQSLSAGRGIHKVILAPRRENLQRYRQLRVQIDLHSKALSDIRETTCRMLTFLGYKDKLASLDEPSEMSFVPLYDVNQTSQPLMTGIDSLLAQLMTGKRQIEALQQALIMEVQQSKQIEKLRSMNS